MIGRDITTDVRERIAHLLRLGVDRSSIATRLGISAKSVTRVATELRRSGANVPLNVRNP